MTKLRTLQGVASNQATIYVFGSALHASRINDVDVAVVTDNLQVLHVIREEISSDHDLQVIDLTVLSSNEEKQLEFLRAVGAIEVSNIRWTC